MRRSYLVVEGPHDVEFVARMLPRGFSRVHRLADLDAGLHPLVPTKFPHRGDLLKRVPVPTFFAGGERTIAVHSASGIDNLVDMLEESQSILAAQGTVFDGVGVVLDADDGVAPAARHERLRERIGRLPGLAGWPVAAGRVEPGPPRCGAFVLPDNVNAGTLEDLLLEASDRTYPGLHARAVAYVAEVEAQGVAQLGLEARDLKDFRKPSGGKKATVACVASVLRPGKAIQTAIQDCRWLAEGALELPRLRAVRGFLGELLALPV